MTGKNVLTELDQLKSAAPVPDGGGQPCTVIPIGAQDEGCHSHEHAVGYYNFALRSLPSLPSLRLPTPALHNLFPT